MSAKKYTKEFCKLIALKYKTKKDFYENDKRVYKAASFYKWLDEITSHLSVLDNGQLKIVYAYEFSDNHVYIGLTSDIKKRHIDHFRNRNDKRRSPVLIHSDLINEIPTLKILKENVSGELGGLNENYFIDFYKSKKWFVLNKASGGSLGFINNVKWTFETCKIEALKYKYKTEFKNSSNRAYKICVKNKWLDDICGHMIRKPKK